jgi:Rrf2 family protein
MSYSLAFSQSLFVMLYVASKVQRGIYDFVPTQQISQDLNIPPSTAAMILRRLNRAGLIETREGANGGVRLARSPEQVTLLDIFMAIEQERPMFQTNIQFGITGDKPTRVQNAVLHLLGDAEQSMKQSLQGTTIKTLMEMVDKK